MAVKSGTFLNVLERSVIANPPIRVRIRSCGSLEHRQTISRFWMSPGKKSFLDGTEKEEHFQVVI
jgi:hypothetical protein